jgi:hypothetical protein
LSLGLFCGFFSFLPILLLDHYFGLFYPMVMDLFETGRRLENIVYNCGLLEFVVVHTFVEFALQTFVGYLAYPCV